MDDIESKVRVTQRLAQFTPVYSSPQWLSITLDIGIACLCLYIGYSVIKRVTRSYS